MMLAAKTIKEAPSQSTLGAIHPQWQRMRAGGAQHASLRFALTTTRQRELGLESAILANSAGQNQFSFGGVRMLCTAPFTERKELPHACAAYEARVAFLSLRRSPHRYDFKATRLSRYATADRRIR